MSHLKCFSTWLLCLGLASTCRAQSAEFTVHAGDHDRVNAIVTLELPATLRSGNVMAIEAGTNQHRVVQQTDATHGQFLLPGPLKAGTSQNYRLQFFAEMLTSPVQVAEQNGSLKFSQGQRQLLTYNVQAPPVPELSAALLSRERTNPEVYVRSGHIHPVYTPMGKVVTDGYPVDIHTHQHGVFHAWTRTTFQGHMVDFWNQHEKNGPGTIEHRELIRKDSGPVFGSFQSKLAYIDLTKPGERTDALNEQWTVRVYGIGSGTMFEIETLQTAVGDQPITLDKYTYGGMAIRGAAGWYAQARSKECNALTSEGKDRVTGNNTTPNWCDLYGKVDGEVIGIAMFSHPSNPASPQPVRIHNDLPYFVYSPVINGAIAITPEKPYQARYLVFAHDGAPNPEVLNGVWNNYAHPPRVEWK